MIKAAILKSPNSSFVIEDLTDPIPGPGEAVARVYACGSGLTIQHVKAGRSPVKFPRVIGHEISGKIVAVGSGVQALAVRDPVTAYFYLTCGRCKWCRIDRETLCENFKGYVGRAVDGGYAEYIKLTANSFIKLPNALDFCGRAAEVSVIADAVATPVQVIRRARVKASDTVAVIGAVVGSAFIWSW